MSESNSTRITFHLNAPRSRVFRALVAAESVAQWMVPDGMTISVHDFDPREGGAIRVSLAYVSQSARGKTTAHTDTYHGRFVKLVPDEVVIEALEFETEDPLMAGEMTITYTLTDAPGGGTVLAAVHTGLPPGIPAADNETGWRMSLGKLKAFVEADGV